MEEEEKSGACSKTAKGILMEGASMFSKGKSIGRRKEKEKRRAEKEEAACIAKL